VDYWPALYRTPKKLGSFAVPRPEETALPGRNRRSCSSICAKNHKLPQEVILVPVPSDGRGTGRRHPVCPRT